MSEPLRYLGQAVFYIAAAIFTGFLATHPIYVQVPADQAQIKLSFSHGGARKEPCRALTPEEIAKLPREQKRPNTCSRERIPVRAEITVDGQVLYDATLPPTGLSRDGPSNAYEKFLIRAGSHRIVARLRDTKRTDGFDYESAVTIDLKPLQNLAIDFHPEVGGFVFR